ncbi:DUF362 domain-containing protein [Candidatus Synechococcus calcipolaris G9]|uniref:DUF362 domain-containing protein n=1 Tax=Candidatus Synechococcus calcipolaris G9 TaxID=1497997 RepID=A0ABT6F2Y5_9SYNE|nr:DUF362 domain-containing protein [Candidatus Synechococcus calcipolaris]MDG2992217.1 DUF362 domain-containing protein [Candidatus Synechococcus calcipolaris G9]
MSSVSLLRATTYGQEILQPTLGKLLEPLGGMAAIVKPGDRVLLKPNLLTGARPGKECVTRPELVYAVAKMVKDVGGEPFLGDGPAFGTALGVARANGYLPLIQDLDLPVIEFHGERYETVSQEFNHLRLSKEAMAADVVINLPKVKSHVQLTLTMGVKNLFGCVPGKMKAWWHMEAGKDSDRFGRMLVETARAISPNLTIMDGIIGHEGNGPSGGTPRPLNLLAASPDVFALDQAISAILQVNPDQIPTLRAAKVLGIGPEFADIDFPLLRPEELAISDWKLPTTMMPIDFGAPRVLKSTFKHLYIRWIKEPLTNYSKG